jgi:hypothetical protein
MSSIARFRESMFGSPWKEGRCSSMGYAREVSGHDSDAGHQLES